MFTNLSHRKGGPHFVEGNHAECLAGRPAASPRVIAVAVAYPWTGPKRAAKYLVIIVVNGG